MLYRIGTELDQIIAIVEGNHLYIGRQYLRIQLTDFFLDSRQHLAGVLPLPLHHNTLYDVVPAV
ncbi:hypothetical protein D3C87_1796040 [compost metagenome]